MEIQFDDLEKADLIIDRIYKGEGTPNMSAEPFHKLIPGCENSGGFRKRLEKMGLVNMLILCYIHQWKSLNDLII